MAIFVDWLPCSLVTLFTKTWRCFWEFLCAFSLEFEWALDSSGLLLTEVSISWHTFCSFWAQIYWNVPKCIADLSLQHTAAIQGLLFHPLIFARKPGKHFPTLQAPFPNGKHDGRSNKLVISIILKANTPFCTTKGKWKRRCVSLCRAQRGLGTHPGGLSSPDFCHWKRDDVYL